MINVLLIYGDGGTAFDKKHINKIKEQFEKQGNCKVFLSKAIKEDITKTIPELNSSGQKNLIFINAHGYINNEGGGICN